MEQPESSFASKEKPIEIDEEDESSDGENSVIILDSDTEPDNDGEDENREDEEQDDDDEESEDSESDEEEEDSDSSDDSDSVNSVWSDVQESAGVITAEAAEAEIVKKFEKAITFIADNRIDRGQKLLQNLLDDPIISCYRQGELDYEAFEEPPRYAKMLKVYIAVHKNLAKLCEKELEEERSGERILGDKETHKLKNTEIQHLCQVLAYEPNNTEIWLDVAMKCVEIGDLNFAKYSFKRCETLKESLEAHATVLYITCDYSGCLTVLKQFQEQDDLNDKMKYLKHKVRSTNQYYKCLCDRIFDEDEVYADIEVVEKRKIIVFDERIDELKRKTEERKKNMEKYATDDNESDKMSTIPIKIYAELDLRTVCILFCDLFDRIQAYSHPREQLVEITEWESRQDYLDVVATVEKVVDIVSCVEELTQKTEEEMLKKKKKGKRQTQQEKKEYLANWRRRLFVERTNLEDVTESEANTTADEDDSQADEEERVSKMPDNELAQEFHLEYSDVVPIRCDEKNKEKIPPPSQPCSFIDCDQVLSLLESALAGETKTIVEFMEFTLNLLTTICPSGGALPEEMREVTREMYNRLAFCENVQELKFLSMSVLVFEVDCRKATQVLVLRYLSPFWKEQDDAGVGEEAYSNEEKRAFTLRFMWKYAHTGLKDETKLEYLHTLRSLLRSSEVVATSSGPFSVWDIDSAIDDLEKKKRVESVKHLWMSNNYGTLVEILKNDIDFSTIGMDEAMDLLSYWIQSLEKLKSHVELMELIARAMHFYMFFVEQEEGKQKNVEFLLQKLHKIPGKDFSTIPNQETLFTIGYFICHIMKKYPKFEKDWRNWRVLYEIVKIQRGDIREYIEQLNKNDDPDVMPLLELDLLVKAHEVLGEHHCCAQKNYDFLLFTIDRYRELVEENIPILEICYLKDNGFLWNNLNAELAQILFCLYGKYSRKVRARDNHENGGKCGTTMEIATRVLSVILVQPLPLHDEKDKLMHDVVDLINTKYPYLLEVSDEKKAATKEFEKALQQADSIKEVNSRLDKCRDDLHCYLRSMVWYSMSLHSYRTNAFKEAAKYAELYLLTEESVCDNRLRMSAWAILALTNIHDLFQLDLHEIHEQWKWRIMPSRLAIQAQEHEPLPHFELAARLYQLASCLARFHRTLPKTDPRRQDFGDVAKLRQESRKHFDISIELTKINENGTQPEHQWLCYYFIGKLEAKSANWDILKVVESFYEAACGCELTGFYYPQKVQTKKQQNFEPIEVHYQAFSSVYKYIVNNETPDLEILQKLKTMLCVLSDGHKVVKQSSSLFKVNPDVYEVVEDLVMNTVLKEKGVENNKKIPSELSSQLRDELFSSLKEMCFRAFTLLIEKFPHMKSYYRLAQLYYEKGEFDMASEQIFKNAFKRKKRDDGMFDNCVEISCADLNRNGSYSFHIERCVKLGAQIAQKTKDLQNVVAMLQTMIGIIVKRDEQHIDRTSWRSVITTYLAAMDQIVHSRDQTSTRSTPSPGPDLPLRIQKPHHLSMKSLRTELWRIWQSLNKCSKPQEELIRLIREKAEVLIARCFGSVDDLRRRMQPIANSNGEDGGKKKNVMLKRKFDAVELAKSVATNSTMDKFVQRPETQSSSAGGEPSTSNSFAQMVQSLLMGAHNSPNKQTSNDLMLQLSRLAAAQAPSTSQSASTVRAPALKPPAPKPTVSNPVASASIPTTSKQSGSAVPTKPVVPRYSPISSDDDIQCIEPPAKKPKETNNPQQSKPAQDTSKKPSNPVTSTTKSNVDNTPTPSSSHSQQSKLVPGTSSASKPPASANVATPSTSTTKSSVPGPSGLAAKTPSPSDLSQLHALMTNNSKVEELSKFVVANMNSANPGRKQLAAVALQHLLQSNQSQSGKPTASAAPKPIPPPPTKLTPVPKAIPSVPKTAPTPTATLSSNVLAASVANSQMLALQKTHLAQQNQRTMQEQRNAQQLKLAMEKAAKHAADAETARKEKEQQRDYFQQVAYNAAAQSALEKERQAQIKVKQALEKRELLAKQAKEKQAKERQAAIAKQREKERLEQQATFNQFSNITPAQLMNLMMMNQMNLPSTSSALPFSQQGAQQAQATKTVRPVATTNKSAVASSSTTSQGLRTTQQHPIVRPQPNRVHSLPQSFVSQAPRVASTSTPSPAQSSRSVVGQQPTNATGITLSTLEAALQSFDEVTRNAIRQQFLDGSKRS